MDILSVDSRRQESGLTGDGFPGDLQVLGESGIAEEFALGLGQGLLHDMQLG